MSSQNGQGPLLYIHQPFSRVPANNMQEVYTNKRDPVTVREDTIGEGREDVSVFDQEVNELAKPGKGKSEKNESSFKRVKSFKEMDLQERLDYLINFPQVLPPVPCVFYTKADNYQGYLMEYQQDEITIRFHDQSTKTLPVSELQDIIMIGIKR